MKCYGFTINLRDAPNIVAQYKEYHRAIPPEVLDSVRKRGILKNKIFLLGRRLFMYIETTDDFDPKRDLDLRGQNGQGLKEVGEQMANLQEPVPEAQPGEWWAEMELVVDI